VHRPAVPHQYWFWTWVVRDRDYPAGADGATMRAMPDYGAYCPVSLSTEVLADRWTPLVVRELLLGNTRFNDIARGLPGISRTLLTQRLRHLERRGVVELWPSPTGRGSEYHLTPAGKDLFPVVEAMASWAIEWLYDELRPEDVAPTQLMWWMHRRIDVDALPPGRVVVEFEHTGPTRQTIWLVLDRGQPSVCVTHPGMDVDVVVSMATPTLSRVFNGFDSWPDAVRSGAIEVAGPPTLVKALPRWFAWSPFREATLARTARAEAGA
jgi:DNA-binding HxlR family transcriptional regulator